MECDISYYTFRSKKIESNIKNVKECPANLACCGVILIIIAVISFTLYFLMFTLFECRECKPYTNFTVTNEHRYYKDVDYYEDDFYVECTYESKYVVNTTNNETNHVVFKHDGHVDHMPLNKKCQKTIIIGITVGQFFIFIYLIYLAVGFFYGRHYIVDDCLNTKNNQTWVYLYIIIFCWGFYGIYLAIYYFYVFVINIPSLIKQCFYILSYGTKEFCCLLWSCFWEIAPIEYHKEEAILSVGPHDNSLHFRKKEPTIPIASNIETCPLIDK